MPSRKPVKGKEKTTAADRLLTATERKAALVEEEKEAALLKARYAPMTATVPPIVPNDGNFYILYINVGLGDCTMIRTPGGRKIMIDCGSSTWDTFWAQYMRVNGGVTYPTPVDRSDGASVSAIRAWVQSPGLVHPVRSGLDMLVLTHGDSDHYDQLDKVISGNARISTIYHSYEISDYGKAAPKAFKQADRAYRVTVNGDTSVDTANPDDPAGAIKEANRSTATRRTGTTFTRSAGTNPTAGDPLIPVYVTSAGVVRTDPAEVVHTDNIRILTEDHCTITIIASEVIRGYKADKSDVNGKNRGSIVLLIEAHGKKLLLSGDATVNTEKFLLNTRPDLIKGVDVVRASHHGSGRTSSDEKYVEWVDPHEVRISAARRVKLHHLPNLSVVGSYEKRMAASSRPDVPVHEVWCWDDDTVSDAPPRSTTKAIYSTGSKGTDLVVIKPSGGG